MQGSHALRIKPLPFNVLPIFIKMVHVLLPHNAMFALEFGFIFQNANSQMFFKIYQHFSTIGNFINMPIPINVVQ